MGAHPKLFQKKFITYCGSSFVYRNLIYGSQEFCMSVKTNSSQRLCCLIQLKKRLDLE
ncbi:hypothetical protein HOLleu_41276 [Holothuria leucospilota]|uniref:Uncharacterized protein n=1 Tax=Holothuria leucospilota TaxID=206669 RepID=A0A9Q0YE05_HOLLE|nr:hypothetical protein HOLleu_41276 [Holothuria leucospilota]